MEHTPENLNQLGRAIAGLRHRKGWSQTQLANKVGISTNAVSDYETGKRKRVPKRILIEQLDAVLDGEGELVRKAGYTPVDDMPESPTDAILEATARLRDAVHAASEALYVMPSKQQLERLSDGDLVTLSRLALAVLAERTDDTLRMVVQSIRDQLKTLGSKVG